MVIAPIPPFRGGIARHSIAMAAALRARDDCEVRTESFARLYPAWLYPGANDRDPTAPPAEGSTQS